MTKDKKVIYSSGTSERAMFTDELLANYDDKKAKENLATERLIMKQLRKKKD